MAFGCCHVVAAGSVFLESCSMSLLKISAWGKASRSRGVSWGSHLAFLIGFSELCSDEMKSQIEKGGKMAPKGSEEKKNWANWIFIMFWRQACAFWAFETHYLRWGQGGELKTGHSFTQSRTSLYNGIFNTKHYLFNHSATAHRDGLPGRRALRLGCRECVWGQDLSLLLSRQPDVTPTGMTPACAQDLLPSLPHSWEGWHSSEWHQGQSGWTRIVSRWLLWHVCILT